jgi:hypothetical protein
MMDKVSASVSMVCMLGGFVRPWCQNISEIKYPLAGFQRRDMDALHVIYLPSPCFTYARGWFIFIGTGASPVI